MNYGTVTSSGTLGLRVRGGVTVAAGVTIAGRFYGAYGGPRSGAYIANFGTLRGGDFGVRIAQTGTINNGVSSLISGDQFGVSISGAGVVTNDGTVQGSIAVQALTLPGTLSTSSGVGVALSGGGSVSNGLSSVNAMIIGASYGVVIQGGAGTVVNSGTIAGVGTYDYQIYGRTYLYHRQVGVGVQLGAGGSITNGSASITSASLTGGLYGVVVSGGMGLIKNYGDIGGGSSNIIDRSLVREQYSSGGSILLSAGGTVENIGSLARIAGTNFGVKIAGAVGLVTNFGSISASGTYYLTQTFEGGSSVSESDLGTAVLLSAGGTLPNGSSLSSTAAAINGSGGVGVYVGVSGLVQNYGTIMSVGSSYNSRDGSGNVVTTGTGVFLASGKLVNGWTSVTDALIQGGAVGVSVSGTVANDGTIMATHGVAVIATGRVSNGFYGIHSALIEGSTYGVQMSGTTGTVVNDGTIEGAVGIAFLTTSDAKLINTGTILGASGVAVRFTGGNDRVMLGPGAVFGGAVIANAAGSNLLELQIGRGTLSGIGSNFTNFNRVLLDPAATWTLAGTNTATGGLTIGLGTAARLSVSGSLRVGPTLTLNGAGTLAVGTAGAILVGVAPASAGKLVVGGASGATPAGTVVGSGTIAGSVVNNGQVIASGSLTLAGPISGTGTVAISANSVLAASGKLATPSVQFLSGANETLALAMPKLETARISGFAASDRIDLLLTQVTLLAFAADTRTLTVKNGAATVASLHFASTYATNSFSFGSDGKGGTNIHLV